MMILTQIYLWPLSPETQFLSKFWRSHLLKNTTKLIYFYLMKKSLFLSKYVMRDLGTGVLADQHSESTFNTELTAHDVHLLNNLNPASLLFG